MTTFETPASIFRFLGTDDAFCIPHERLIAAKHARHTRALFFALSIALIGGLFFTASRARAQARPSPATQVVSVDLLPLVTGLGPMAFQYEYKVDPVTSWELRFLIWPYGTDASGRDWTGYGLGGAYRFYIADSRALTGLSVAPAADLIFFHSTIEIGGKSQSDKSATCFDIGGDLAYKWIFEQFAVEPMLGLRIGFGPNVAPSSETTTRVVLGLSLGYAW